MVERDLAKVEVASSTLVSRSIIGSDALRLETDRVASFICFSVCDMICDVVNRSL